MDLVNVEKPDFTKSDFFFLQPTSTEKNCVAEWIKKTNHLCNLPLTSTP